MFLALVVAATISVNGVDPGGEVYTYELWWKRIAEAGLNVRINGACVSACSIVLEKIPSDRICITPLAQFGLHQEATDDGPDPEATEKFVKRLPQWVRDWLKTQPPLGEEPLWLTSKEIGSHLRHCS